MRVLIVKEKHGTGYYDVSSDELLHRVCACLLKQRLEEGWYGDGVLAENDTGFESREAIEELPEGSVKEAALQAYDNYVSHQKAYEEEKQFIEDVKKVIKTKWEAIPANNRWMRQYAFGLLESRSRYEYEYVTYEHITTIEELEEE